jgi:hypothetical protein
VHSPPEPAGNSTCRPWPPPAPAGVPRAPVQDGTVARLSPQRPGSSTPAGRCGRRSPCDDTLGTCRRSTSAGCCAASAAEPTCPSGSWPLPAGCPSRPWRRPRAGGATCPSAPWSEPLSRPGCGWRCSTVPVRRSPGCPRRRSGRLRPPLPGPPRHPLRRRARGALRAPVRPWAALVHRGRGPGCPRRPPASPRHASGPPPRSARGLAAGAARPAPGGRTAAPTGGAAEPARWGGSARPRRLQLLLPTGLRRAGRRRRAAGALPGVPLSVRPGLSPAVRGDDAGQPAVRTPDSCRTSRPLSSARVSAACSSGVRDGVRRR